jgi:ribonuclease P protein component
MSVNLTPPKADQNAATAASSSMSPAASLRLVTLTQRPDFQRASRAAHTATPGFVVQMRRRAHDEDVPSTAVRVGFTCSKKVGNAVARNRAKRRLREIARLALPEQGLAGCDYVLIGRKNATADLPFQSLQIDFSKALNILHGKKK